MLNHADLNLLRVLAAFSEGKSLNSVSQAMKVTPSAVSQSLKRLEKETGLQLFIRSHKKLTLTQEGRKLLESVFPFLQKFDETLDELLGQKKHPSGLLRVGAPTEFAVNFLIPVFSQFAQRYPAVSLKLKLGSPRTLIQGLVENELDLAYSDDGPYFSQYVASLATSAAFHEELVLACSRAFFDRHLQAGVSFKTLTCLKHVDYGEDHSAVNIWYRHHFKKAARSLDLSLVSENVHALIQGIKQGLGLGMVPRYLIGKEVHQGSIVVIETGRNPLKNAILLVQHQARKASLAEKALIEHVSNAGIQFQKKAAPSK